MGDLDYNQIQLNQLNDVADDTVVPIGAEIRANHYNERTVRILNRSEWTNEQKQLLVNIDTEERIRGKGFMKRIKQRWDLEYPDEPRTAQNLIDNVKRFKKEGFGLIVGNLQCEGDVYLENDAVRTSLEWTAEMKTELVILDQEERAKGRGFMKRVKERWDSKYPKYQSAGLQTLRDNAARFKKDPVLQDLILVRKRDEVLRPEVVMRNDEEDLVDDRPTEDELLEEEPDSRTDREGQEEISANVGEITEEAQTEEALQEKDKELELTFKAALEKLKPSTMLYIEPREKLPKVKLDDDITKRADKILDLYLLKAKTIPELTDIVYAMGKAVADTIGMKMKEKTQKKGGKPEGGNRRERKLKTEMKILRQNIARAGNELHRRKQLRKATKKEKNIIHQLKERMDGKEVTPRNLRAAKELWIDQLRYKKVKLSKNIEKRNRKKDNIMFQKDQKNFFRSLEKVESQEGEMPEMEKFVEFWGGIWEQNEETPNMQWMEEVKKELNGKVDNVNQFEITEEKIKKETSKRKNWTAPGIDGIQNYWWKKFTMAQKALVRIYTNLHRDTSGIPEWWPSGRTVLLPKTRVLSDEKNYRPITCLNTSYKILTGLIAKYMKEHTIANEIWDEGQLGAVEDVLGTVDQLIIDRCIMEEVKQHQRNLAVAFYDYKKAYDKVHHDWMIRVYEWIGIPREVIKLIVELMNKWKTRLEIWNGNKKITSRWIQIMCGFLQGDSYSPVGFCISEIPVCVLLQHSRGYRMGDPGNRDVKRTHSLFVDDLKVYQESHETLKMVNEMIVQASHDTGACYGVSKCAEIVFQNGKMTKGEGLQVLAERMKTMDPDENDVYRFLGIEQADGLKTKNVYERVKEEVIKRVKMLTGTELNDINLIKAINMKVIPAATYAMNVCKFTQAELKELDQIIKKELRNKNMLGRQASDERLYLKREKGGRGLKSLRDAYKETRLRVACYMAKSCNIWIEKAWMREESKEENAIVAESILTMEDVGLKLVFDKKSIWMDNEVLSDEMGYKATWRKIKMKLQKRTESKRIETYKIKEQQSQFYQAQEEECHVWLKQNLHGRKISSIMTMLEQMVETRAWKVARGLDQEKKCRVCKERDETIEHLVAGCKVLANNEYLSRHNRALMIIAVAWGKELELINNEVIWYQERWNRGTVFENEQGKLIWDFEFNLRKTTTARRPDLILEDKRQKRILICDMTCPQQRNIETKRMEKLIKYRQLAFEMRERRPGYTIEVVPIVIGALGGGMKQATIDIEKILTNTALREKTVCEMQKTILMDSETIIRKVLSGLIQECEV